MNSSFPAQPPIETGNVTPATPAQKTDVGDGNAASDPAPAAPMARAVPSGWRVIAWSRCWLPGGWSDPF
ncbi:MAG: hypothetical protein ACKVOI_09965 [Dongiaceae bacterium]